MSADADTLISTALNRPLFSPGRRPPDAGQSARQSDLTDKRLAGIMVNEDRRVAIFAVNGSKSLMVGEGEEINGWRVEAITPLEVSLSGPDGVRTLQPKPDANSRPLSQSASNTRPPQAAPPQPPSSATLGATAEQTARRNRD
ncbi:MAG: hypothetical protein JO001_24105 [Alphaproteobacteria bacterium]|nr:hypothetical protein [Alphaproteobacteria bacterium]